MASTGRPVPVWLAVFCQRSRYSLRSFNNLLCVCQRSYAATSFAFGPTNMPEEVSSSRPILASSGSPDSATLANMSRRDPASQIALWRQQR